MFLAPVPPEEASGPSVATVLADSDSVLVGEVVETHELDGREVEEAAVRSVLKGRLDTARVLYESPVSCWPPRKPETGTTVLLFLKAGDEVRQHRRFWKALDQVASPSEFFELVAWGRGRLEPDAKGLVDLGDLEVDAELPVQTQGDDRSPTRKRLVPLTALIEHIEKLLIGNEQPLQ